MRGNQSGEPASLLEGESGRDRDDMHDGALAQTFLWKLPLSERG
jgi:hypothetical protein